MSVTHDEVQKLTSQFGIAFGERFSFFQNFGFPSFYSEKQ